MVEKKASRETTFLHFQLNIRLNSPKAPRSRLDRPIKILFINIIIYYQFRAVASNRRIEAITRVNILNVFIYLFIYLCQVLVLNNYNIHIKEALINFSLPTTMHAIELSICQL